MKIHGKFYYYDFVLYVHRAPPTNRAHAANSKHITLSHFILNHRALSVSSSLAVSFLFALSRENGNENENETAVFALPTRQCALQLFVGVRC